MGRNRGITCERPPPGFARRFKRDRLPRLRQPLYYYRQYFAPGLRGLGQAVPFLNHARRVLEAHDAARPKPEAIGVLLELENPRLASRYDRAVIPEAGATYVGISARGLPLFAAYFEHVWGFGLAGPPFGYSRSRRTVAAVVRSSTV